MVTFESYKPDLSDCERMISLDHIMKALKHPKVRLPFFIHPIHRHTLFSFVETPHKFIIASHLQYSYYYQGCKFVITVPAQQVNFTGTIV